MNIDEKRFLRRHLPSFVKLTAAQTRALDNAVVGKTVALRSDGVVFYKRGDEVYVGWLERTDDVLCLKEKPETRSLGWLHDLYAELEARVVESEKLLGSKVQLR